LRARSARLAEGVTDEEYAAARAEIDAEITGYQLGQLRRELGLTQARLALLLVPAPKLVHAVEHLARDVVGHEHPRPEPVRD
jgi:hypothetical protein